ncbi:MAG TPA: ATP-dependent DNA helicase RecG [Anaerolineaceae bacterium]|nr:ATP-dependent DNA helicase RecG [Anaerolineaceae bacterium]
MQPSLEKLHKFFRLETERGFDNRAVVGGLNKILPAWETEARIDHLAEEIVRAVIHCLDEYPGLEPKARSESLKNLWRQIQENHQEGHVADLPRPHRQPLHEHNPYKPGETRQGKPNHPIQPPSQGQAASQERTQALMQGPTPPRSLRRAIDTGGDPTAAAKLGLSAPLTVLPGIGPKHAETLSRLGLKTLGDMLYYFPRRYDDYSQLKTIDRLWYGEDVTVIGTVQSVNQRPFRGGHIQITEVIIGDGTGFLRATWFNQPWIATRMSIGLPVSLSGKVGQYLGRLMINNPDWEPLDRELINTNRIVPIYPLSGRITQRWLRTLMNHTVNYWAPRIPDYLPNSIRQSAQLVDLSAALLEIHFPNNARQLQEARERLAFDEIFLLQLGVIRQKQAWQQVSGRIFETSDDWLGGQTSRLPYLLTEAQHRAIAEIRADLASGRPMNRLLQGDVGSGKTVVGAIGIGMVVQHGAQAAVMAPTSILAEQHFHTLTRLLCPGGENSEGAVLQPEEVRLLIGDTPETEKREIREGLSEGRIKLVIGTHSLIEAPIVFQDLQFIIVDEQHRFGVEQRAILRSKGTNPHLLVMTATPIPRSLALTVYGDLDLTVMDEMPAGRQEIETHVVLPVERERAYSLIRSQVNQGYQAFIIYPLVEQGERDEVKAAVEEYEILQKEIFPHLKLGLLHGRMRPEEKDEVMAHFRDGEYSILVSTSVVEVGVDIPNATVMLIEGANRFGLAQLHQFRGRVGRGDAKSYCLLIPESENAGENERLQAMVMTNDGFVLAEKDLEQRGPGEFLGTRQSGYSELRLANLTNVRLIEKARNLAQEFYQLDPTMTRPEHGSLEQTLRRFWGEGKGDIS